MSLRQPLPPAGARDPVTPEGHVRPVTPEHWASGPPSEAQPLLRQEAKGEEEEGEETGVQGASGTGTAEQRRRGWGEAAEAAGAEEGQVEAGGTAAAGSGSPAGSASGDRGDWRRLLAWLRRRQPQCCPCAAPLPRSAAHCCHGGTKMAALAYNLGKREINHYFSVRSAKVLALVAVLLLAVCHLASRRYRGERALPLPRLGEEATRRLEAAPRAQHTPTLTRPPASPRAVLAGEAVPPRAPRCPQRRARRSRPSERTPVRAATVRGPVILGPPSACAGVGGDNPGLARGAAGVRVPARAGWGEMRQARGSRAGGRTGGPWGPARDARRQRPPCSGAPSSGVGSPILRPRGPAP